jgi:hypothetical protein
VIRPLYPRRCGECARYARTGVIAGRCILSGAYVASFNPACDYSIWRDEEKWLPLQELELRHEMARAGAIRNVRRANRSERKIQEGA